MFTLASSSAPRLSLTRNDFFYHYLKALHTLNALHLNIDVIPDDQGAAQVVTRTGILGVVETIVPVRTGHDVLDGWQTGKAWLNHADAKTLTAEINGNRLDLERLPILLPEHGMTDAEGHGTCCCIDGRHLFRNFLVIDPEPTHQAGSSHLPDERVTALARHLNNEGFAYVARSSQKEMADDRAGVRYLPLGENLPSFGTMTAVIVVRDPEWVARASSAYPEADIFLLKLS